MNNIHHRHLLTPTHMAQPRAVDTLTNWQQSLFYCCTASLEQAASGAEAAAVDQLVSSRSENISV